MPQVLVAAKGDIKGGWGTVRDREVGIWLGGGVELRGVLLAVSGFFFDTCTNMRGIVLRFGG